MLLLSTLTNLGFEVNLNKLHESLPPQGEVLKQKVEVVTFVAIALLYVFSPKYRCL